MIKLTHKHNFTEKETDRIIEMAWEDRTPLEAIKYLIKITEAEVIGIMRLQLKPGSFRLWRQRVQ